MLIFALTLLVLVLMALARRTLASEAVMIGTRESLANSPKEFTAATKRWFIGGGTVAAVASPTVGAQFGFEGAPIMVGIFALVFLGTIWFIVTDLVGYVFSGVIARHRQARYEPYSEGSNSDLPSSDRTVGSSNKPLTLAAAGASAATSVASWDRNHDEDGGERNFTGRFQLHDQEIGSAARRDMSLEINPANGLPMVGAFDIKGNPYGFSGEWSEHKISSPSDFNHTIDFGETHDFSSGSDFGMTETHHDSFMSGGHSDH